MGFRALLFIAVVLFVSGAWTFQSLEGDHIRTDRAAPEVKISIADTQADSDSKAKDGMASSSSSTKGSAAFIKKYPHPDLHHHEGKEEHLRLTRSIDGVKIAIADTEAKSDSKADHGKASSSSSTKGNAAFVSKHHHDKHRRSARDVNAAVAETDAESDSKAKDGAASSSSSTKGNAAFVSKGHHHEEKEIPDHEPEKEEDHLEVAVETPEDHKEKNDEGIKDEGKKEIPVREPFIDLKPVKEMINQVVKDSVDF